MAEIQATAMALPEKTGTTKKPPPEGGGFFVNLDTQRGKLLVLGRPGSDLLSQGLSHSTIGAEEFNGRVRDGIGLRLFAKTTRPAKDKENEASCERCALGRMVIGDNEWTSSTRYSLLLF